MYFADQEKVGDTTVLSFDWEHNLANASSNFGDETLFPVFKYGYTVTFNPRGGTIDGEESAIYELDTKSENFFNIGDYVPEREGYTFLGWCYKPSALYDSLIKDTSNYDWINNTSGNVKYISSKGIVLDATDPVIIGVEDGKTYCEKQTVTVDEKYIDSVKVNSTEVPLNEYNQFTLNPADGEQTIVVTDRAGNKTAVTVTVNNGHTDESPKDHECDICGKYFSDKDGKNSIEMKDIVISKLPSEIIEGKGQSITAGEKKELTFRSNAAFSDFIRVELDGKTLDEKNYTVKEGSTVVTLKADYVATLSAGEHTIGIVSTNGTAASTFTVNAKAVVDNDTKSPQTGDNSHMALWIALLGASVFGLARTAVYSKRKRAR